MNEPNFQIVEDEPIEKTASITPRLLALVARLISARTVEIMAIGVGAGLAGVGVWKPTTLRLAIGISWSVLVIIPLIWRTHYGK